MQQLHKAKLLLVSSLLFCGLFTTGCGWRLTNVPPAVVFLEKSDPIRLAQDVSDIYAYYFNSQGVETLGLFDLPAGAWVVYEIDGLDGTIPNKEGE